MAQVARKNRFEAANKANEEQYAQKPQRPNAILTQDVIEDLNENQFDKSKVIEVDAGELSPFPDENIRLSLHEGLKKDEMLESIKTDGIMNPVLVWIHDDKKIILSGHNRVAIAKELNIKVPIIVTDIEDDDIDRAKRFVIITNIQNRQLSSMKEMEICNLFTNLIESYHKKVDKMTIYEEMEEKFNIAGRSIREYLSLGKLTKGMGELLDSGVITHKFALMAAKRTAAEQNLLVDYIKINNIKKADNAQATKLGSEEEWNAKVFDDVFKFEEKKSQNEFSQIKKAIKDNGKKYDFNRLLEIIKKYY